MSNLGTELRATVTAEPERGLIVKTEQGTIEPGQFPLSIAKGAAWSLFVAWYNPASTLVDLSSGYSAQLVIYGDSLTSPYVTMASGAAITLGSAGMTIAQTQAEVAAYTWGPRARYRLTVTETNVRSYALLEGFITLA